MHIADVDLDGRNDVLVVHDDDHYIDRLGIYRQRCDGSLAPEQHVDFLAELSRDFFVGDLLGNKKPDIVNESTHGVGLLMYTP